MEASKTAEQELQEYLQGGPKAEIKTVEKWLSQGKTAQVILDFLKSW